MQTLLIVDDDPAIREVFSILLSKYGYKVHAASGGMECLDCLGKTTADLVMLDIMMHPVDGWETLTAIRKNPRTGHLPAIMFSGKSPSLDEVIHYGGWIEDYLMKPLTMKTISESLTSVFERHRADMAARAFFLKNGVDQSLVDEYFHLRRFLFIHEKFSREFIEEPKGNDGDSSPQRLRFEELARTMSASGAIETPGSAVHGMRADDRSV
jgi:two-component system, OmpR family, response regulator